MIKDWEGNLGYKVETSHTHEVLFRKLLEIPNFNLKHNLKYTKSLTYHISCYSDKIWKKSISIKNQNVNINNNKGL